MRHVPIALAVAASLTALPVSAQTIPAAPSKPPRSIAATGQTKPPAAPSSMKASTEAAMLKAQKASQARDKAWDTKMHDTMGSICRGC